MTLRRAIALLLAWPCALGAQVRPPARPPAAPRTAPAATVQRPNIIVLMVDDLGWQDLSVPLFRDTTAANRRYLTPAIAQLAAQGVSFTDAYASAPTGLPTRAALLTGQTSGITTRTAGTASLPRLLRAAGYRTIHVGTTDWSATGAAALDAKALGFDESMTGARRADSLTIDAIRGMDAARALQKPFLLYVAYDAVRLPSAGDARFVDAARARGVEERDAVYASLIAGVDQSVGDLTTYLETNGIADRTLLVLVSDNGGLAAPPRSGLRELQNAPLRGGMGSAYEGGLRVPMIVRWPGVARKGLRSSTPVIASDLFPTLLRAARVPTAAQVTRGLVGRDLASTLDNSKPLSFDRPLLWHAPDDAEPFSALRAGNWKLLYFYLGSRYELYDLSKDIGEGRELSMKQPEIAARLSELLRRALTDAKVSMPIDSAYGRPFGLPGRLLVPAPLPPSR